MADLDLYDVAIIGGGLAGLAVSIQLARKSHKVIVFEKLKYPVHKVCGEFISMEAWDFLNCLGVNLDTINVPVITRLQVSSPNGKLLERTLPLGGFGISRYKLDNLLLTIAREEGVIVQESTKVNGVLFTDNKFNIETSEKSYRAKLACGCFGKRSNLDIKWKRPFAIAAKNKLNNYIGVKYHIKIDFASDTVALHNFKNGYCGIVKIEDGNYNLCYLTTAENLKENHNNIKEMEQLVLRQNPHLEKIWSESRMLFDAPLTISQISFDRKSQVENHMLMIGDAAGMITPLCGNGMSMALHSSKIAFVQIHQFLQGIITRNVMEKRYCMQWNQQFASRLLMGRRIQRIFGSKRLTNWSITFLNRFPAIVDYLIKQTHGDPF
ncbi:MAG: NAD(P)/FAD-dependent oxidoreductase [Flavisolibacter sp.]